MSYEKQQQFAIQDRPLSPESEATPPTYRRESEDAQVHRVRQAIIAASGQNTELLRELAATADAPGLHSDNEAKKLRNTQRLKEQAEEVEVVKVGLRLQTDKYRKLQNSIGRRLIYKLRKKTEEFEQKAATEQGTYHESLEKRAKAETIYDELQAEKVRLEEEGKNIKTRYEAHGAAHIAIDKLYAELFDGPTPGFPDEDAQEYTHKAAKTEHEAMLERAKGSAKGKKYAEGMLTALNRATFEVTMAENEAKARLTSVATIEWRLGRAIEYIGKALKMSAQAVEDVPAPLPNSLIHARDTLDALLLALQTIPTSRAQWTSPSTAITSEAKTILSGPVRQAHQNYQRELEAAAITYRENVRGTARLLEDERQGLQQLRQAAFEEAAGFGEAAPAYRECCDRVPWLEAESDARCAQVEGPVVDELEGAAPPPEYRTSISSPMREEEEEEEEREYVRGDPVQGVLTRVPQPISVPGI